jgi:hypothetical protein
VGFGRQQLYNCDANYTKTIQRRILIPGPLDKTNIANEEQQYIEEQNSS